MNVNSRPPVTPTSTTHRLASVTTNVSGRAPSSHLSGYPLHPSQPQHHYLFPSPSLPLRPSGQAPHPNSSAQKRGLPGSIPLSGCGFVPGLYDANDLSLGLNLNQANCHLPPLGVPQRPNVASAAVPGTGSSGSHLHLNSGLIHHHPNSMRLIRPRQVQLQQQNRTSVAGGTSTGSGSSSAQINDFSVCAIPKAAPSPSSSPAHDANDYQNVRKRSSNSTVAVVKNRKVKISEGATLYALCRSWLRNGLTDERQPCSREAGKSLPKPFPVSAVDAISADIPNDQEEEDEDSCDYLNTRDLLRRHVSHAKNVKARLTDQRSRRIARYRDRLALLLPPHGEQVN